MGAIHECSGAGDKQTARAGWECLIDKKTARAGWECPMDKSQHRFILVNKDVSEFWDNDVRVPRRSVNNNLCRPTLAPPS